jgi:steroid 5-alpha reductase family enzyme
MTTGQILSLNLLAIASLFVVIWCLSLIRRDASIVDIFWGLGFLLVAAVSLAARGSFSPRAVLLTLLVGVWGVRLAGYLLWRNWGKAEDYRYQAMRERHGGNFAVVSLFTVFCLQGFLTWIISLPVQVGIAEADGWNPFVALGLVLWASGLFFEAVGDYQLARFKADPANRGHVMNRGLWRYTRHPNYFGDFLVWWGLYLVAAEPGSWWWTIVGPLLMSVLLIRVSGVRLLESSLRSRLAGYEEYVRTTSPFFPLPPKRDALPS